MTPKHFLTRSLRTSTHGERVARILATALGAVDPAEAVKRHLHRDGPTLTIDGRTYDLQRFHRVLVIGFGKASTPMAEATAGILGKYLTQGIIIPKSIQSLNSHEASPSGDNLQPPGSNHQSSITIFPASHPIPDERSIGAAQAVIDLLADTSPNDLVLCLISGGGSALLTAPVPEVSLADLQALTASLLACGATINEINCLRKHLSLVKGGGLARLAAPAQMVTLILSDVVGDPLDVIASGPTAPDPTTFTEALGVLEKHDITDEVPPPIVEHLHRGAAGDIPETPKAGDLIFEQVQNVIVGNNLQAAQAAIEQAKVEGFNALLLSASLQGEASATGQMLSAILRQITLTGDPLPRPACIVAGGETTVTLAPPPLFPGGREVGAKGWGEGGRNQELALATVTELAGLPDVMLITLATDGDDGPTDAAGAVVTGETLGRAKLSGLDPLKYLARHDAYNFFDPLGDLLKPGPTQTNVNDLTFIFAF